MTSLNDIIRFYVDDSVLLNNEGSPFRAVMQVGSPKLAVLVGPNASGKSLLFRAIAQLARGDHKIFAVTISIRERTGGGAQGYMQAAFMFGDETPSSTGAISARVVQTGFKQAKEHPWMLLLDEPELGLSEGYARALGEWIGRAADEVNEHCAGVMVVTHSRPLVRGLVRGHREILTFVGMQPGPSTLDGWLETEDIKTIEDLEDLPCVASENRKKFQQMTNNAIAMAEAEERDTEVTGV